MSDLAVLDPRAAFVDVGSEKMHVSIGGGPPQVSRAIPLDPDHKPLLRTEPHVFMERGL